jgi:hypothetical protein
MGSGFFAKVVEVFFGQGRFGVFLGGFAKNGRFVVVI